MSKSQKKKVRQINPEEVQHLRRRGLPIPNKTKSPSKRPLRRFTTWWETTAVEKFLEDVVFLLKNAALLDIINLLAGITIIISLITWWTDRKERWENEIFSTWQVVNSASEDRSGVVRIALERLLRNEFSLAGLKLKNSNLFDADLQEADLAFADLQKANLAIADLQEAILERANLQGAFLIAANLQKANLSHANLQKANLFDANLQEANLFDANLQEANLFDANLTPKQIKSACFWDKAIYKGEWLWEEETSIAIEPIEPDNTNYIKELKKDTSSNPKEPPDCSGWSR